MKHKNIKKVLMCKPLHFSSLNYAINPWMTPGTIDDEKSMHQWESLVKTYQDLGLKVEIIEQHKDSPDMVFAADQSIAHDNKIILSRFWHPERRGETKHYDSWFRKAGFTVQHLPDDVYFEGQGNSYFWNDLLFIGVGYRSDHKAPKAVAKIFDREVIPLEIVDPHFYHLDVGFLPLNKETAFYYPAAFSEKSKKLLKKTIPNLLEFTKEEAMGFCGNSVITGQFVVHQKGTPSFNKKLKNLGYQGVEVDLSEFKKSGGGAHCLTNILE